MPSAHCLRALAPCFSFLPSFVVPVSRPVSRAAGHAAIVDCLMGQTPPPPAAPATRGNKAAAHKRLLNKQYGRRAGASEMRTLGRHMSSVEPVLNFSTRPFSPRPQHDAGLALPSPDVSWKRPFMVSNGLESSNRCVGEGGRSGWLMHA